MQCTIFHSTVPFQYSGLSIRGTLGGWAQRSLPTHLLSGREGPVKEAMILMYIAAYKLCPVFAHGI